MKLCTAKQQREISQLKLKSEHDINQAYRQVKHLKSTTAS